MKNTYLLCVGICILVASCKKDSIHTSTPIDNNAARHSIDLTIDGFEATTEGLSTNSVANTALKDDIKFLQFVVYKYGDPEQENFPEQNPEFNYPVISVLQKCTDADFGKLKVALPDGHYWFFIVGDQLAGKISLESVWGRGGSQASSPHYHLENKLLSSGIYYTRFDTTITASTKKAVKLKRMVSKVTMHIKDAIPANAAKFILTITDYPPAFNLLGNTGMYHGNDSNPFDDAVFTFNIPKSQIGKSNFEFNTFIFPYGNSDFDNQIILECQDNTGKVIHRKVMPIYALSAINTNYIFSGSMFTQSADFKISVDKNWNDPVNVPFSVQYLKLGKGKK
jgi:hypothetical protein